MKTEVVIPSLGESVSEATIALWLKKEGEMVHTDDELFELESDKATLAIPATEEGILHIVIEEGTVVRAGDVAAYLEPNDGDASSVESESGEEKEKQNPSKREEEEKEIDQESTKRKKEPVASPAAKKILNESGTDSSEMKGTGKDGRITKPDALSHVQNRNDAVDSHEDDPAEKTETGDERSTAGRTVHREPMSRLRKTISQKLVEVKQQTAMLTTFNEVDMSGVKNLRDRYKDEFIERTGVKPGITAFFAMAATVALQEFPALNAKIEEDEILYYEYVDLGISVSTDRGLLVPVIRNTEQRDLASIEKEIQRLAKGARDKKLSMDELSGGTFSITNGGVFGSLLSTPLLNGFQSGILGLHNIVDRPVAVEGRVEIRPMMYLALSYDHRIVDGKESVSFLKRVCEMISDPVRLLLKI